MMKSRRWFVPLLSVAAVLLAACGGTPAAPAPADAGQAIDSAPLSSDTTLSVGLVPSISSLSLFVAQARGYFTNEHLDVSVVPVQGFVQAMPLLATGKLDAVIGAPNPGFINGVHNGIDAKFVAALGEPRPGAPNAAYMAKTGGPITDVASLRGHKVAVVAGLTGAAAFLLSEILAQGNLTIDDVTVVNISGYPDGLAALQNGSVDATIVLGLALAQAQSDKTGFQVGNMDTVIANGDGTGLVYGSRLLGKDTGAGVAFIRAIERGAKDLQGDYMSDPQIRSILAKALQVPEEQIAKQAAIAPMFSTDMTLKTSYFERLQTFFTSRGVIANGQGIAVGQAFDGRFVDAAAASSQ